MKTTNETMKFALGEIHYNSQDVVRFDEGLYGFESFKEFILIAVDEHLPFEWLVAIENPELMFPVIDPYLVCSDYNPQLTVLQDQSDRLLVMVSVSEDKTVSANLRAPLVIEEEKRRGHQAISRVETYSMRHPLKASK